MNPMRQTPTQLADSSPFARGFHNLHVERLLLITHEDDRSPCFRPFMSSTD